VEYRGGGCHGHILFANSKLADDNSANNSVGISINVTAPGRRVHRRRRRLSTGHRRGDHRHHRTRAGHAGRHAHIVVTVKNVGGQDVTGNSMLCGGRISTAPSLPRRQSPGSPWA